MRNSRERRAAARKKRRMIWGGIIAIAILLAGTQVAVMVLRYEKPLTAAELHQRGQQDAARGRFIEAYKFYCRAVEEDPENTTYLLDAAKTAFRQQFHDPARKYALKMWSLGERNAEVLRLIVLDPKPLERPDEAAYQVVLQELNERVGEGEYLEVRGDVEARFNRLKPAIDFWLMAFQADPDPGLILKICAGYRQTEKPEFARALLEEHREQHLDEMGFQLLAGYYAGEDDYAGALTVIQEAENKGQYGDLLRFHKALYLFFVRQQDAARKVLESMQGPAENVRDRRMRLQGRFLLGFIYLRSGEAESLQALHEASAAREDSRMKEAEDYFFKGARAILDRRDGALKELQQARQLLAGQPLVELIYASQLRRAGRAEEGIKVLQEIKGVYARLPEVMVEIVLTLNAAGREKAALRVINELHKRRLYTKRTLSLYRDLALKHNLPEIGQATQTFLESQFPEDPMVQMFDGLAALREQDYDSALEIFEALSKKDPEQIRYQLGKIQALLSAQNYQEALDAAKSSTVAPERLASLV